MVKIPGLEKAPQAALLPHETGAATEPRPTEAVDALKRYSSTVVQTGKLTPTIATELGVPIPPNRYLPHEPRR